MMFSTLSKKKIGKRCLTTLKVMKNFIIRFVKFQTIPLLVLFPCLTFYLKIVAENWELAFLQKKIGEKAMVVKLSNVYCALLLTISDYTKLICPLMQTICQLFM